MDYEQAALHGSARRTLCILLAVGLIAGLFSGMFGIGGGTVIVPALVWIGLTQRQAAATSICAIIITSISGVISYAHGGDVDWIAALLLAYGGVQAVREVAAQEAAWGKQIAEITEAAEAGAESVSVQSVQSHSRFTIDITLDKDAEHWPNSTLQKIYGVRVYGE